MPGALLALGVVALLVVATNPFALLFLLPSLHVWLWLPQVRAARVSRARSSARGFAGPRSCSGRSRAGTGSAGTRRGTSRRSSRSATRPLPRFVDRARLGRGGRPAGRARRPAATRRTRARPSAAARAAARDACAALVLAQRRRRRASEPPPRVTRLRCHASHGSAALLMLGAGVLTLVWAVLVWQWQDPFTALYTHWQQHRLARASTASSRRTSPCAACGRPAADARRSPPTAKAIRRTRRPVTRSAGSRSGASACTWCSSTAPTRVAEEGPRP